MLLLSCSSGGEGCDCHTVSLGLWGRLPRHGATKQEWKGNRTVCSGRATQQEAACAFSLYRYISSRICASSKYKPLLVTAFVTTGFTWEVDAPSVLHLLLCNSLYLQLCRESTRLFLTPKHTGSVERK